MSGEADCHDLFRKSRNDKQFRPSCVIAKDHEERSDVVGLWQSQGSTISLPRSRWSLAMTSVVRSARPYDIGIRMLKVCVIGAVSRFAWAASSLVAQPCCGTVCAGDSSYNAQAERTTTG